MEGLGAATRMSTLSCHVTPLGLTGSLGESCIAAERLQHNTWRQGWTTRLLRQSPVPAPDAAEHGQALCATHLDMLRYAPLPLLGFR